MTTLVGISVRVAAAVSVTICTAAVAWYLTFPSSCTDIDGVSHQCVTQAGTRAPSDAAAFSAGLAALVFVVVAGTSGLVLAVTQHRR